MDGQVVADNRIGAMQLGILWGLLIEGPYIGETRGKKPLIGAAMLTPPPWGTQRKPDWTKAHNIRSSVKALKARGLVRTERVLNRKTGCGQNKYILTDKGRAEMERRRQEWEDKAGIKRTGVLRWERVAPEHEPEGRQRWWAPELLDMGWKALLEYSGQWGWRFKLTRPDGKESGWIYCAKQDQAGAKAEAQATFKEVTS